MRLVAFFVTLEGRGRFKILLRFIIYDKGWGDWGSKMAIFSVTKYANDPKENIFIRYKKLILLYISPIGI
jgi:hypothetical protein